MMDRAARCRTVFIDNIRVALTAGVVFQHADSWYWIQPAAGSSLTLTVFCVINQAFYMGFFFLIAGYFTPASYEQKGQWRFIGDRLLRLGVPLLVFVFMPPISRRPPGASCPREPTAFL